jgi:hypothetical protein
MKGPPDVLFYVRAGESNDELRFSLRSLRHLPHGRVWIAGHAPSWISDEVGVIPREQNERDKHTRAKWNLLAGLEAPGLSPSVYLFNDDFYVMAPVLDVPIVHLGLISQVLATRYQGVNSRYVMGMRSTRRRLIALGLGEPLCYETHTPMLVVRARLAALMREPWYAPLIQERSMYGNLEALGGREVADTKVYGAPVPDPLWNERMPFLSSSDSTFRLVAPALGRIFRDRSPYERRSVIAGSLPSRRIARSYA